MDATPEPTANLPERAGFAKLDPRYVPLRRTVGWIATACSSLGLLMLVGPILLFTSLPSWARGLGWAGFVVLTLCLGLLLRLWPALAYRRWEFRAEASGLEVRHGVLWRRATQVPRSRIQHTEVSQGPLERKYGLSRLSVYTAGTAYARVSVPGLEHARALELRDLLQPREAGDAV